MRRDRPQAVRAGRGPGPELLRIAVASVLLTLTGLSVWSVLPMAFGWTPYVVTSGSMEPGVRVGDVVVGQPAQVDRVQVGQVVLARASWAGGQVVAHRVVALRQDGGVETRGDANQDVDPAPVAATAQAQVARLRVPLVGLPFVWAARGEVWPVFGVLVVLTWLTAVAVRPAGG